LEINLNVFHSIIITGGNQESREEAVGKIGQKERGKKINQDPDTLIINRQKTIGIEAIRKIKKWLSQKAYQEKKRLIVIYQAQQLTIEAQNAFLKTLEEPPKNTLILLAVDNSHRLLPTIISRCQIVRLKANNSLQKPIDQKLIEVFNKNLAEKIIFSQKMGKKKKEEVLAWLAEQKQALRQNKNRKNLKIITCLDRAEKMIEANLAPRLALTYCLITNRQQASI
jgi:DNA polymerase III delta prime subunit